MQFGTKVTGRLKPIYVETLDLSTPGELYQVDIETEGIVDEEGAVAQLLTLEQQFPDLKIVYINTDTRSNVITIQFMDKGPGQFSFTGLIGAIPAILGIIFIAVIAFVLWQIYSVNPIWLWALLALGAGVAFFYFTSGHIAAPAKPIYEKKKEPEPTPTEKLRQERLDARAEQQFKLDMKRLELEEEKLRKETEKETERIRKEKEEREKERKTEKKKRKQVIIAAAAD